MSLEDIKLPFLKIKSLEDKFKVCVAGNSSETTQYTKEGARPQKVLHVLLQLSTGEVPIRNSPADFFLSLSNHAQRKFVKLGVRHLDELRGKIVSFKKVDAEGFAVQTIEPMKIEDW